MLHLLRHLSNSGLNKAVLLQGNASWHTGHLLIQSTFLKKKSFIVKGFPQLNLIENMFSLIKHRFCRRKHFSSHEEEIRFMI